MGATTVRQKVGEDRPALDERSKYLRELVIETLDGGSRGHIGSTLSLIEIMRVLYDDIMVFDSNQPHLPTRDRLILSKGHGCIALYVMLADKGFFPKSDLRGFCRYESRLGGHPEWGHVPGVEASTGALGHGLSLGVGMAQSARIRGEKHRIFVVVGDGEIDEGSVWEAAISAGHHRFGNLTVVIDYNKFQSYGATAEVWNLEPLVDKWRAFGFTVMEVDGHDVDQLRAALRRRVDHSPTAVIAHTIKGRGVDFAEGVASWHHKSNLKTEDIDGLREAVERA